MLRWVGPGNFCVESKWITETFLQNVSANPPHGSPRNDNYGGAGTGAGTGAGMERKC